jgi:NAD-dependent deacetylase
MNTSTLPQPSTDVPSDLVTAVRSARRIAVLSGAGMSAESGIPTFRDALTGLWAKFDPQQLATKAGFQRDPALVWGWYEARRRGVLRASPNAGHMALCELAKLNWLEDFSIITQNVDDLHERAGSSQVIHLHGSLFAPRCIACGRPPSPQAAEMAGTPDGDQPVPPPRCPNCGGMIRPGVVWFHEELPTREWSQANKRVQAADLLLVVGTSGRVQPAASLPEIAERRGAPVWVIDPDSSLKAARRKHWCTTAAVALPALVAACKPGKA